jgi:hypothetical protein
LFGFLGALSDTHGVIKNRRLTLGRKNMIAHYEVILMNNKNHVETFLFKKNENIDT